MFYWNSNTTDSALVEALQNSIGSLKIESPRFDRTELLQAALLPEQITKIVPREDRSRRTTLQISPDSKASKVILLHGIDEPSLEQMLNSPWSLQPGDQGYDDLDGGYEIYAYAIGGDATIKMALEY